MMPDTPGINVLFFPRPELTAYEGDGTAMFYGPPHIGKTPRRLKYCMELTPNASVIAARKRQRRTRRDGACASTFPNVGAWHAYICEG